MLAPLAVQDGEEDPPLQLTHGVLVADQLVDLRLTPLVGAFGVRQHRVEQTLLRQPLAVLLQQFLPVDADRVESAQRGPQLLEIPVLRVAVVGGALHVGRADVPHHVVDLLAQVLTLEHPAALGVDDGPLLVHHLVVLEDVLPDLEVLLLDLGLGAADRPGHHLVLDRDVVGHPQPGHHHLDHAGVEAPHQLIAQGEVEPRLTRVALPPGPTAQLVVDAPRLVALGAQHVETAGLPDQLRLRLGLGLRLVELRVPGGLVLLPGLHRVQAPVAEFLVRDEVGVATEHDVGSPARHVGGHRDRAPHTGEGDDGGLPLVVLGVEDLVLDTLLGEDLGEVFGALDARRPDQHRLPLAVPLLDVLGDGLELRHLGLVDQVRLVLPLHRAVRRDGDDTQLVDLVQLGRLGLRRTGHPGQLVVEAEVVLQRDGGQRLVLGLDRDPLLGLDGLVHPLVVPAPREHPAGELVDDHHVVAAHDVVLVLVEQLLGLQRVVQVAHERGVRRLVEVLDTELVLDQLHTGLGHTDGALALVDLVVLLPLHQRRDPRELLVPAGGLVGRAGDDQRGPGLVDEDGVHLVDHGEVVAALHAVPQVPRHVVAQVVETELVVGAVGDVRPVGLPSLLGGHLGDDDADLQAQEAVDPAHPLRVTFGQVVVGGDDVNALTGDRVQVGGQRRGERLALTGAHLGDLPEVQGGATHELHIEVTLAQRALGGLPHDGEGLWQQLVETLAIGVTAAELVGLRPQLIVGQRGDLLLERVHVRRDVAQALESLALAGAEQSGQDHSVDLTS